MNKIVYNECFGGFSLSNKAGKWLINYLKDEKIIKTITRQLGDNFIIPNLPRHHPLLVKCVEELKEKASGECANLQIFETKSNIYRIDEYGGMENVVVPDNINWIIIE